MEIREHISTSGLEFAGKRRRGPGLGHTKADLYRVLGKFVGTDKESKPDTGGAKPARGPSKNRRNETISSEGKTEPHKPA